MSGKVGHDESGNPNLKNNDGEKEKAWEPPVGDITGRKRMEERAYLAQLSIDQAMKGIVWFDPDGRIIYANNAESERLGYSHQEMRDLTIFDIYTILTLENWPMHWQQLKESKILKFETEHRRKEGDLIPVEVTVSHIQYKAKEFCFVINQDISEKRQVERERENLQAKLSDAIEIAHIGPWEYDFDRDLFYFNDQFYKMFRTNAKQMGGYAMRSEEYARRFLHPEDAHIVADAIRKASGSTGNHLSGQLDHRILYADGTPGYITVRYFTVKDSRKRAIKGYGVSQASPSASVRKMP